MIRWRGTAYRGHEPIYAFDPLSGEGARIHGGRFNRIGTPALYLSTSLETASIEVSQSFGGRLPPTTLCEYDLDVERIFDLTSEVQCSELGILPTDLACGWLLDIENGKTPVSWLITDELQRLGAYGIVVPSFATAARAGMTNIVLWTWGPDLPHKVTVHDPSGRLPKNQLSWK